MEINNSFNIWQVLAGLAFFMIGMGYLEDSLKKLAGRRFKLFLRKQATHKLRAIGGAAIVTGLLQSSSIVNLMVLAFAGTGIITMQHSLALILGANLGTTLDTWIVATIGFKVHLSRYALPLVGIAGIARLLIGKERTLYSWSGFALGIGFLLTGLNMMQEGMTEVVKAIDLSKINGYPSIMFLLIGVAVTSLIQSSSATIAIVLAALHVNAISLYSATAIVLGSEIGTTLKLLIVSNGNAVKKKVAVGNFLYNSIGSLIMLVLLRSINDFITDVVGIEDKLIALSFFQTFINIISITLFFPFLTLFGRFLDGLFKNSSDVTVYISKVPPTDPEVSLEALKSEGLHFITSVIYFYLDIFSLDKSALKLVPQQEHQVSRPVMDQYDYIKHLHGDIYEYYVALQGYDTSKETTKSLDRLLSAARNGMYAAKSIKDAIPDIDQLRNSANEIKFEFYEQSRDTIAKKCFELAALLHTRQSSYFEDVVNIYHSVQAGYTTSLNGFYRTEIAGKLSETEISTLINYNREMYSGLKSLVLAVKDSLLSEQDAAYFDELPGFIR